MKLVKKAEKQETYGTSFIRKQSCVGCLCDSKQCSPSCPKVLK